MTDDRAPKGDPTPPSPEGLETIEDAALGIAREAGEMIAVALGGPLGVGYKDDHAGEATPRDPVSEIDRRVETLIRARIDERFPGHRVLGEEMGGVPDDGSEFVWAIDPIDGTANFVNGFPLFAASIGVLRRGRPAVGAVWCSTSHALRAGVYHARRDGPLRFEGAPVARHRDPTVRRFLAGEPETDGAEAGLPWDVRVTGSAAVECAFTAAGLLRVARFRRPNVWDVAGGLVLVTAGGGVVRARTEDGWAPFEDFALAGGDPRYSLVVGEPEAVEALCRARA